MVVFELEQFEENRVGIKEGKIEVAFLLIQVLFQSSEQLALIEGEEVGSCSLPSIEGEEATS